MDKDIFSVPLCYCYHPPRTVLSHGVKCGTQIRPSHSKITCNPHRLYMFWKLFLHMQNNEKVPWNLFNQENTQVFCKPAKCCELKNSHLSCCCSLAMLSLSCLLLAACACMSFSRWPNASFSCWSWLICFACCATCCFMEFRLSFKSSMIFFSSSFNLSWSPFAFPVQGKSQRLKCNMVLNETV